MATRKLSVEITGDAKGGVSAMKSLGSAGDSMGTKMQSVGKKVGTIFKGIGLGVAAGAVVVGKGLFDAVSAARESAKISAETARVIETTGAKSWGASADAVANYSEKLAMLTGVDDEVIQGGANLLLTFTNVQNAVGKGNDIFDQAVSLANDMSTALGTDMKGASMQLGKALNDPTKGISALARAGVSFTQQQKDQIKAMQASGDMLGAQKIILKELGKEFGGAAAAAATPMDRLKVTLGNLQEEVGAKLIPIIDKATVWFADNLPAAMDKAGQIFSKLGGVIGPVLKEIVGGFKAFTAAWKFNDGQITSSGLPGFMEMMAYKIRGAIEAAKPFVGSLVRLGKTFAGFAKVVGTFVKNNFLEVMAAGLVVLTAYVWSLIPALVAKATAWWGVASAMIAANAPVVLVVAALAALAAGAVWAYKNVDWFRTAVDAVARFLTGTLWPALQSVASYIVGTVVPAVVRFGQQVASFLWPILQRIAGFITGTLVPAFARVASFITGTVIPAAQQLYKWFAANVLPILQRVAAVVGGQVVASFNRAQNAVRVLIGVAQMMYSFFSSNVLPVIQRVASGIGSAFSAGFGAARAAVQSVISVIQTVIRTVQSAIDKVQGLVNKIKGVGTVSLSDLPAFAKGGKTPPGVPYLVGEEGPEIRIDGPGTIIPNNKIRQGASASSGSALGAGGSTIVNVYAGYVATKEQLADEVARALNAKQRRNGSRPILAGVSG